MESLLECNNIQVFKTQLINCILHYRWNRVKWVYLIQAILYLIMMILLTIHTIWFPSNYIIWISLMSINALFFTYELIHFIKAAKIYMSDFTNFFDIMRVGLVIIYLVFVYLDCVEELVLKAILSSLTIIVWIRGITYLRVFSKARRLIRITFEVFKDVLLFLFIFFILTLSLAIVFFVATDDNISFADSLEKMYLLDLGKI